MIILLQVAQMI